LLQAVFTHLSSNSGLLEAAERSRRIENIKAVNPNGSGPDAVRNRVCFADVAGPNCGRQTIRGLVRSFDHFIVTSDWWHQAVGWASIADGVNGGDVDMPDTVSNTSITDGDIQTFLAAKVTSGALPAPDSQTLYVLYYPSTTSISSGSGSSCVSFGGYHSSTQVPLEGGVQQVAYAVLPRCDDYGDAPDNYAELTYSASHEIIEAATDAWPGVQPAYLLGDYDAWEPSAYGGGGGYIEIADACWVPNQVGQYDETGYNVCQAWSNGAAAASRDPCQPQLDPTEKYFGAAPRTQLLDLGGGHMSYGYLVVPAGKSVEVILDVFSEAALAHDFLLYVGKDTGAADPSNVGPIGDSITANLSRQQVHNGNGVIMTLSAPTDAVPGKFQFQIRSVLDSATWHAWPLYAWVK